MRMISHDEIAGGKVQRSFRMGDKVLMRGHLLSELDMRRIPISNRNALVDKGFIHIQLKGGVDTAGGERFVVPLGFGRYDVIEGRKLNADGPLSREAAHLLAKVPLPKKGKAAA